MLYFIRFSFNKHSFEDITANKYEINKNLFKSCKCYICFFKVMQLDVL